MGPAGDGLPRGCAGLSVLGLPTHARVTPRDDGVPTGPFLAADETTDLMAPINPETAVEPFAGGVP